MWYVHKTLVIATPSVFGAEALPVFTDRFN